MYQFPTQKKYVAFVKFDSSKNRRTIETIVDFPVD